MLTSVITQCPTVGDIRCQGDIPALRIRFLTSTLRRLVSLVCTSWSKSIRSYPIPTIFSSTVSIITLCLCAIMRNRHAPDSASTHYDGLGEHQVKAISTASVRLLDSDEACATLFQKMRTNVHVTFAPTFVEDFCSVILSSAPPPFSTLTRRLRMDSASVALQLVTPTPTSTLPHRPCRWLNLLLLLLKALSLPTSHPGRHRLVPSVPPVAHVFYGCRNTTASCKRSGHASLNPRQPGWRCHLASQTLDQEALRII
jgi:hypothetical protein